MKQQIGHYDIVAELGRGGMGVVYKAHEAALNRYVAIKVLAQALAHDAGVRERFLREARSMAALNDPHIIQIYAIGDDAGQPYFVMEFVEGESLGALLQRVSRLSVEQAAKIVLQAAQGLGAAHDRGVIHRDVKPGNLMISSRGVVKIADFGIALAPDFSSKLTSTGEFVGTPGYLSPEVCLGQPVDQRSDIFALGVVLFEMLTGRMPFTDASPLGLMLEVVRAEIPDVRELNAGVDAEITRILGRMIAKDPAARYQSCQELAADLARHPLLASGAALTLAPAISAAAATVVGQKTPQFAQPLPAVNEVSPTAVRTPLPAPGGHASVLARSSAAAPSKAWPWALAALLLLGIGGGAFALRGQIPMLQGTLLGASVAADVNPGAAAPAPSPVESHPAPVVAEVMPALAPPPATSPADASAPLENPPAATAAIALEPAAPDDRVVPDRVVVPAAPTQAASIAAVAAAPLDPAPAPDPAVVTPPPVATAPAPVDSVPPPATQVATAAPVERRAPPRPAAAAAKPQIPTIAVVAAGDGAIAHPAEQAFANALTRQGFRVLDMATLPRVGHLLRGDNPDIAGVLGALANTADVVVYVNAQPVGSQELTYYGESSTLYTVQLGVKAYQVAGRQLLGGGWNEQINFTALNAATKAREAVEPMLDSVADRLSAYRAPAARR